MPGMCKIVASSSHPRVPIRRLERRRRARGQGLVAQASFFLSLCTRDLDRGFSMESVGIHEVSMGGEEETAGMQQRAIGVAVAVLMMTVS